MTTTANAVLAPSAVPVASAGRIAAHVALACSLLGLLALAALHVLKPDLDPGWHVASEYALGRFGWVMGLCFSSLAVGCASLFVALVPQARGVGGRIGLALLLAAAVGGTLAAMNPMDPIATRPEDATATGRMHGVSAMIGVPSQSIAAVLLSAALRRRPRWVPVHRLMLAFAHLGWVSMVAMYGILAMLVSGSGRGGPGLIGWANRLLFLAYGGWVMIAAWPLVRGERGGAG